MSEKEGGRVERAGDYAERRKEEGREKRERREGRREGEGREKGGEKGGGREGEGRENGMRTEGEEREKGEGEEHTKECDVDLVSIPQNLVRIALHHLAVCHCDDAPFISVSKPPLSPPASNTQGSSCKDA